MVITKRKTLGIFLELVNYTRKIDVSFNSHMKEAHIYKGTSKIVQNGPFQCMLHVCHEHIVQEIKEPSF